MTRTLRMIAEVSLTYAPDYLAGELGYFADEGLELITDFDSGPGGSWLADTLAAGKADIARGGIWIPLMNRGVLETVYPFAMLCDRNAQLLLAREPLKNFTWTDLYDKRVLVSAAATSQWMFLRGVLDEAGIDRSRIKFVRDLHTNTTTRLWRGGYADFLLSSPPACEQLIAEGAHVATSMAVAGGRVPWSIYYASAEMLADPDQPVQRFIRAISRGKRWMKEHTAAEAAQLLSRHFSDFSIETLAASIARMNADNIWTTEVTIPRVPTMRYQDLMVRYGLVDEVMPYDELVRSDIAHDVDLAVKHQEASHG